MRLTDEILRASDDAKLQLIGKALALGSAGQFGLFPSQRPFNISLNIGKENIDVVSLSCLAITRSGNLIDVDYNTKFDNAFETIVPLPHHLEANELYLTIGIMEGQWRERSDGYEEPVYQFGLVTPNSPILPNALPIARLVNGDFGGWHMDDIDFVPPCLFVSSHHKFEELFAKFQEVLTSMNEKARSLINSEARTAFRTFWPLLQQIMIETDKSRDFLTPRMFLGLVQRYICAFTTSFELDENIGLADTDTYYNYAFSPYNPQNVYQKAKEGVDICFAIREKADKIQLKAAMPKPEPTPQPKTAAPFIAENQLYQNCSKKNVIIPVTNPVGNATVFYSTDGSEPTQKLSAKSQIVLDNGFNKQRTKESDKTVVIKLKAVANGVSSEVTSFTITLHKDYEAWNGIEI